MKNKTLGLIVKVIFTFCLFFAMFEVSALSEYMANLPYDLMVFASALVLSTAAVLFVFGMYYIWAKDIQKLKGLKTWLDS